MSIILATRPKAAQLVINKGGVAGPIGAQGTQGPLGIS